MTCDAYGVGRLVAKIVERKRRTRRSFDNSVTSSAYHRRSPEENERIFHNRLVQTRASESVPCDNHDRDLASRCRLDFHSKTSNTGRVDSDHLAHCLPPSLFIHVLHLEHHRYDIRVTQTDPIQVVLRWNITLNAVY